jgi:hypothetical protein
VQYREADTILLLAGTSKAFKIVNSRVVRVVYFTNNFRLSAVSTGPNTKTNTFLQRGKCEGFIVRHHEAGKILFQGPMRFIGG